MSKYKINYYEWTFIDNDEKLPHLETLRQCKISISDSRGDIYAKLRLMRDDYDEQAKVHGTFQPKEKASIAQVFREAATIFYDDPSRDDYDKFVFGSNYKTLRKNEKPRVTNNIKIKPVVPVFNSAAGASNYVHSTSPAVHEFSQKLKDKNALTLLKLIGGSQGVVITNEDDDILKFLKSKSFHINSNDVLGIPGVNNIRINNETVVVWIDKRKLSLKTLRSQVKEYSASLSATPPPSVLGVSSSPSHISPKPNSSIAAPASSAQAIPPSDWIDDILNSPINPTPGSNSSASTTSSAATSSSHAVFPQNSLTDGWISRKNITIASFKFELIGTFLLSLVIGINIAVVWLLFTENQYFEKFFKSGAYDFWFIQLKNPEFTVIQGLLIVSLIAILSVANYRVRKNDNFLAVGGAIGLLGACFLGWGLIDQLFHHFSLVSLILLFLLFITFIEFIIEASETFLSDDNGVRFSEYLKKMNKYKLYSDRNKKKFKEEITKDWKEFSRSFVLIAILGVVVGGVGILFGYSYLSKNVLPPVPTATQVLQNGDYYFETTSDLTKDDGNYLSLYQYTKENTYGFVTKPSIQDNKNASDTLVNPFENFSKNSFKYTYITSDINYYNGIISGKDSSGPTVYFYTENQLKSLYTKNQKSLSPAVQQLLKGGIYLPIRTDSDYTQSGIISDGNYSLISFTETAFYQGILKKLPFTVEKNNYTPYTITGNSIKFFYSNGSETYSNLHLENGTIVGTDSGSYVDKDKKTTSYSYSMKFLIQQQFEQLPK